MNYIQKLKQSSKETGSIACMGLDPVVEDMPEEFSRFDVFGIASYFEKIFFEMKKQVVIPGAFKANQGFYIQHDRREDFAGSRTLDKVLHLVEEFFPGIPIILDYKRGDISKSSKNYAREGFEVWKADAVTINPYMGEDCVSPFIEYCNNEGKGVYILNRTSNKGAKDFQNLDVIFENKTMPLYMVVAYKILEWSQHKAGIGAVVGATSLYELSDLAKLYNEKEIPLLIPGVGGQGAKADEVVAILKDIVYDLSIVRINSSSGLTHPWVNKKEKAPDDFAKVCVEALYVLNKEIDYKN